MKFTIMCVSAVGVVLAAGPALAQRDAASKIDGAAYEAPYFYNSMDAHQQDALGHATVLQQTTAVGEPVPQAVAQEHVEAIRTNLRAAQKHHASLSEAAAGNPTAQDHLQAIANHHSSALALCDDVDNTFDQGRADASQVNELSTSIVGELKAACDRHRKLAQPLTGNSPATQHDQSTENDATK